MSAASITHWFGTDVDYHRDPGPVARQDVVVVLTLFAFTAVNRELNRPLGVFDAGAPIWAEYLAVLTAVVPLLVRRQWPIPVVLYSFGHFFVCTNLVSEVGYLIGYQALCFFAIYSAAAWARDRTVGLLALGAILVTMLGWVGWDTAMGTAFDNLMQSLANRDNLEPGLLPPITSSILLTFLFNLLYVLGAVMLGRNAWWQAYHSDVLAQQSATIRAQSAELQQQAVVAERLRIARELHDVVAHHVSMMGVQAGAARTLLDRDPDRARQALLEVEESSRNAVAEMRGLLGALRGPLTDSGAPHRPEPTLSEVPGLLDGFARQGLSVDYAQALEPPDMLTELPLPIQLSLYRIISEALTNVQRHSTARTARLVLRGRAGHWVEVEIVDDGRPVPGAGGSGLGQLGMRERAASHGGQVEIGPRVAGGYRVRVRLPLPSVGQVNRA